MILSFVNPVLAIKIDTMVFIIVFTISILSWIVKTIQEIQANTPKRQEKKKQQGGQSDLERFLEEIVGNKRPPDKQGDEQRQAEEKRTPQASQKVPQRSKSKGSRQGQDKKNSRPKSSPLAQSRGLGSQKEKLGDRISSTSLPTAALGEAVRTTVQSSIAENKIDLALKTELGTDESLMSNSVQSKPHPILQTLRNPDGVRQAILVSEILSRPKALR